MIFEKELVSSLSELFPNVTFVFANRNHTEVSDPYCLIQQILLTPIARPEISTSHMKDTPSKEVVKTQLCCKFILTFYSQSDSFLQDISGKFLTGLHSNYFRFAFKKNNISVVDVSRLTFVGESINGTTMLKRGDLTLDVSGIVVDEWDSNDILSVQFKGYELDNKQEFFNKKYNVEELEWAK